MATWQDVTEYVRSHYKIAGEEKGLMIKLVFETGEMRSQLVLLTHHTLLDDAEEWLQISSPVASLGQVDLEKFLEEVGDTVCGGGALVGDLLIVRHAVPLLNLNINEFERPLTLVTTTADRLERELVGGDKY
jgi:hypothetical protein